MSEGSGGSGDDVVAGRINTANSTTDLVGSQPDDSFGTVNFNGEVILRVGPYSPSNTVLSPFDPVDGIFGFGWSGLANHKPGGSGVVGFGGPNQGTGVRGLGGGWEDGKGGIGIHGIGGDGGLPPFAPDPAEPGIGVLGIGGKPAPGSLLGSGGTGVLGVAGGPANGVEGICEANDNSGVFGFNSQKDGVAFGVFGRCDSRGGAGVSGRNDNGDGVSGFSVIGNAIKGRSEQNDGVVGETDAGDKSGVMGAAETGNGVLGTSKKNDGVVGISNSLNKSGVFGFNSNTSGGFAFGVFGRCDAPEGAGVSGRNDAENGDAVSGYSPKGYGGQFNGGRAPLRIVPAATEGPPVTGNHQMGEFYVDSQGGLFFCQADGVPGTWVQIA